MLSALKLTAHQPRVYARHHYLQLPHALEGITIDAELEHIQDLEVEETSVMAAMRWDGATTQG